LSIRWPTIPPDARKYLKRLFAEANRKVAERILNVPNIRETSLDDGFVEALIPYSAPRKLRSGTVVKMEIHNIGGLRRQSRWETADIAVIVLVYRGSQLIARKVGLLQSKRLYPFNQDIDEDDDIDHAYGMNRFLLAEAQSAFAKTQGKYRFTGSCEYKALKAADQQVAVIDNLNARLTDAVYYLMYNPPKVPTTISYPARSFRVVKQIPLACRVFAVPDIHAVLAKLKDGKSPSLRALKNAKSNWRLEDWVDLLLLCKVGHVFDRPEEGSIRDLLVRRTGPISAALAVSIAMPE
jgi:hypothetical protein